MRTTSLSSVFVNEGISIDLDSAWQYSMKTLLFFCFLTAQLWAQGVEKVFEWEDRVLWGFTFISATEVLITAREGEMLQYNFKTKKKQKIPVPSVYAYGQGGLMHPELIKEGGKSWIYVSYSKKAKEGATTALARALLVKGKVGAFEEIFVAKVKSNTTRHFGSRLTSDGKSLFMSIGERGERNLAQDLHTHQGKILRLNFDGTPYKKGVSKGELPEIYSYGHRNPQGLFYDEKRKILFEAEFGPRGGDELNIIKEGKNYGWPIITYGREYFGPKIGTTKKEGMEQPLEYWTPSISPSGLCVYQGSLYKKWRGNLFLANLSSTHLRRLVYKDGKIIEQEKLFSQLGERIRHVGESPDGLLYFSTDSGNLYKINP